MFVCAISIIALQDDCLRGLANQWDKHRGAYAQFSLVLEMHLRVCHCVKLMHTHSFFL